MHLITVSPSCIPPSPTSPPRSLPSRLLHFPSEKNRPPKDIN